MRAKLPLIIIGYEKTTLLAVTNSDGVAMVPVFFDADRAEKYRRHFNENYELKLQAFMVTGAREALNLFEVISISDRGITNVIFDPLPPDSREQETASDTMIGWIQSLRRLYDRAQKNQTPKKNRKPHFPRNQRGKRGT